MKKAGRILGGTIIGIVLMALILCVAAFVENSGKTYTYIGKTVFVAGQSFDFDDSRILQKNENGEVTRKIRIGKNDVYDFSTENAGSGEFVVRVANTTVSVPYTVCSDTQNLGEKKCEVISGTQARIYRDLIYGTRLGEINSANNQTFDVYLPDALGRIKPAAPVVLIVHGGAWMSGDKNGDVNALCDALVREGFVVFSMNYRLATMKIGGGTIGQMLSDIDAMVAHIKLLLPEIGVNATKIGIGGISAGGHLSSLYAYKKGRTAPIEIAFEIDIVGPNQFSDIGYKKTIEPYFYATYAGDKLASIKKILQPMLVELLYSMSGFPDESIPELELIRKGELAADADLTALWSKIDEFSPVTYIDAGSCPTILAYGAIDKSTSDNFLLNLFPDDVTTDSMVPTTCYDTMVKLLKENNVPYVGQIFYGYDHTAVACISGKPSLEWIVEQVKEFSAKYIKP